MSYDYRIDRLIDRVEAIEERLVRSSPALFDPLVVAQLFHEAYERLAPEFGYETRLESAVPWDALPETNRMLMVAVAAEVLHVQADAAGGGS